MKTKCFSVFTLTGLVLLGCLLLQPKWGESWASRLGLERLALAFGETPSNEFPKYRAETYETPATQWPEVNERVAISSYGTPEPTGNPQDAVAHHPYYRAASQGKEHSPPRQALPSTESERQSSRATSTSTSRSPYGQSPYHPEASSATRAPVVQASSPRDFSPPPASTRVAPASGNETRSQPYSSTSERSLPPSSQMDLNPSVVAEWKPCEGTQTLARVGTTFILSSDVLPEARKLAMKDFEKRYQEISQSEREKITPEVKRDLLKIMTEQYLPLVLDQQIRTTLLYLDATKGIPEEVKKKQAERGGEMFETALLPQKMKTEGLKTHRELIAFYKQFGSSIEREKRMFIKAQIAIEWEKSKLNSFEEISHQDMLDYYHAHRDDFFHPGKAQWQQLTAKTADYPSEQKAHTAISQMMQLVRGGMPFAEVARKYSDGLTASEGGVREWTREGSLRSKSIDRALFQLPVGALSGILRDEQGFHVIRVLQRKDAWYTPFEEAQGEIREKIQNRRRQQQVQKILAELKKEYPVENYLENRQTADRRHRTVAPRASAPRTSPPTIGQ